MRRIFKYPLAINDNQFISLPKGAEILTVQVQNEEPQLWALHDSMAYLQFRHIEIFGTGNPIYYDIGVKREYIASFQIDSFVGHVFERIS